MNQYEIETMGQPTARKFHLKCKIVVKRIGIEEEQSKGKFNTERNFVFLIPSKISGETWGFLDAWLPIEDGKQHSEFPMIIEHPFHVYARGAAVRRNEKCEDHYIHLMSYGLAQLIWETPSLHNKEIDVTVLTEHDDALADSTIQGELPFEQKDYEGKESN